MKAANFSELCWEYGVSTKTGYKWRNRLLRNGVEGLQEGSPKPHHSPSELKEEVTCRIVLLKQRHPVWGARKLQKSGVYGTGQATLDVWREEFKCKVCSERCNTCEAKCKTCGRRRSVPRPRRFLPRRARCIPSARSPPPQR